MNEKILEDLFDALLGPRKENKQEAELRAIHSMVDDQWMQEIAELVNTKIQSLETAGTPMKIGANTSTLAFVLTREIYLNCSSEEEVCELTTLFGEYMHSLGHIMAKRERFAHVTDAPTHDAPDAAQ